MLPTLRDVVAARERIAPFVHQTPVAHDAGLTYKLEFLQPTGSFKVRGAFNAALQLQSPARDRGIVAVSGGNHGLAVAYAAQRLGIPATIFMPSSTPAFVASAARGFGAELRLTGTIADAVANASKMAESGGQALLHPFDDVDVIAGQGTVGLEILEQHPAVKRVVVSIGGGGLLAGIALTIKQMRPDVEIVGVETAGADAMDRALRAGRVVTLDAITSIARTLGAPSVCERTLYATRTYVDKTVVVSDRDAVAAIIELQERLGVTVEPASACTLAALRTGAVPAGSQTLLVLCGRNVRLDEIARWEADLLS